MEPGVAAALGLGRLALGGDVSCGCSQYVGKSVRVRVRVGARARVRVRVGAR